MENPLHFPSPSSFLFPPLPSTLPKLLVLCLHCRWTACLIFHLQVQLKNDLKCPKSQHLSVDVPQQSLSHGIFFDCPQFLFEANIDFVSFLWGMGLGLCYIRERNPPSDCCDPTQWPCAAGKRYFGRGPLQLTWNYNYGAAGRAIGFDGVNNPEIVAQNPTISFRTAIWFWMNYDCHNAIVSGRGFGATIRAFNSGECNGGNTGQVNGRISYYQRFCRDFGVDPGANLSC